MQTSKGMLCARNALHYAPNRHLNMSTSTSRPVIVRALASNDGTGSQAQKLFQQHKVLLGAGFSYDQAALILQVSQQRKATPTHLTSAGMHSCPFSWQGCWTNAIGTCYTCMHSKRLCF